jgi:hypothetical protein
VLEFGLVAPMVLLLVFGILQYGYELWSLTTASATAREAARRMVVGEDWTTCVLPRLRDHAEHPSVGTSPVQGSFRYLDDAGHVLARPPQVGDLVEVTVSFQSLYMGLPLVPVPHGGVVTQHATARIENVPDSPPPCNGPGNP